MFFTPTRLLIISLDHTSIVFNGRMNTFLLFYDIPKNLSSLGLPAGLELFIVSFPRCSSVHLTDPELILCSIWKFRFTQPRPAIQCQSEVSRSVLLSMNFFSFYLIEVSEFQICLWFSVFCVLKIPPFPVVDYW